MNTRRRSVAHSFGVLIATIVAIGVLTLDRRGAAAPSPMAPDAMLEQQWHLKSRSQEVGGANVRDAWPKSVGAGVVIGIVDDGLQWAHPDLAPNYLASASFDFNFNDTDPQPFTSAAHGTAVAGVAAARGDNTIGISGVAPQASLAGLRLTALTATDAQEAAAFGFQPDVIHILNNSWNPTDNATTLKAPGPLAAAARQSAAMTGRQGRGRIFVWSSGSGRLVGDDCNFDGYANSRFAIAAGASTDTAIQVATSEGCSALMVLAPSGGGIRSLTTTDLIGTPGYALTDYSSLFGAPATGGMTGGAATVSGAVALMLARNPTLSWRDVKHVLRRTSVRILPSDAGWTQGAFPHNERLGFGLIDADAAVNLAGQWANVPGEAVLAPATRTVNTPIPDINTTGVSDSITIAGSEANFVIEHIEVDFNATHTWRGDLQVKLTSPSGVVSNLAPIRPSDNGDNFTNWRFGSVRHWGESAAGVWTLNVADRRFQDTGTWNNWTLRIYGYHVSSSVPGGFGKSSPANGATGVSASPTLSWTASSGAASYEYCYDTTNDNACSAWTSAGTSTSVALSGLTNGLSYYWQARAINPTGTTYANGGATMFWAFTTQLNPPAAFVKSSPANGATGQALTPTLAWTASNGATNYDYCYDTTNDNACTNWFSLGNVLSVQLTGLTGGTPYYWHVRAANAAGIVYANGASTAFWNFTAGAPPGAFGRITPELGATGLPLTPTLTWSSSAGAAGYDYCYDTTNDNACSAWTGAGAGTSAGLSGLTPGTTYFWHVRAINDGGTTYANGSATAFWSFTTIAVPGAFGKSSPANGATDQSLTPTLSWTASTGVANYDYCYDTTNDNACSEWIGAGASTSAGLTGLAGNTTYYWQVRAVNGGGTTYANGAVTAFRNFTTQRKPRPIVDLNGDGNGDVFTYNPATGAWTRQVSVAGGGFSTTTGNWMPGWTVTPVTFNTDALTDFFLFNTVTGAWHKMITNGSGFTAESSGVWWQGWERSVNDFDGDEKSDLFLYDRATGQWFKCLSTSTGFQYVQGTWNPGWEVYPMSLNSDALGDMFLFNRTTGRWFWVVGETNGSFTYPLVGFWAPDWTLNAGDFNGDGRTDWFLYRPAVGEYYVALNNGNGYSYVAGYGWAAGWTPMITDLNADSLEDLVLYNKATGNWVELQGNGAGQFTSVGQGAWTPGWDLYQTDFNGDGRADLLLYKPGTGDWFQAFNQTTGTFTYVGGRWLPGLSMIVTPPIR